MLAIGKYTVEMTLNLMFSAKIIFRISVWSRNWMLVLKILKLHLSYEDYLLNIFYSLNSKEDIIFWWKEPYVSLCKNFWINLYTMFIMMEFFLLMYVHDPEKKNVQSWRYYFFHYYLSIQHVSLFKPNLKYSVNIHTTLSKNFHVW